jgi:uncharacterized Zn finger protein
LTTQCSCPDWVNPCKHVAATHYILGERFDEDPFLLFRLRGRNQEQVMQALHQRRAGKEIDEMEEEEEPEGTSPLEEAIEHFWEFGQPLDTFSVAIRKPTIEMPLLKRLGDPLFVRAPGLQNLLKPAIHAISQAALESAYADSGEELQDLRNGPG